MVILLSSHRNVPIRAIYLLLLIKHNFCFLLHNRTNCYSRGGHAIPLSNNARIYSTIKDLSVEEARVIERFPGSSVKIKNTLAWSKKKRGIKCDKLGGFIAEYNFRFFCEENDEISLETRFMTPLAKVYENVFQGLWAMSLWCKCLKGTWFNVNRILVSLNFQEDIFKPE